MRIYILQKWGKFKNSKFFLGILCLIIGASGMFIYLEGKDYYEWAKVGYGISTIVINGADASDSPVQTGEPESVSPIQILSRYDWDVVIAKAIMMAESNGETDRIGDKHLIYGDGRYGMSCGLMQVRVLQGRPTCDELLDAETNIDYAYKIYQRRGWDAWSAFQNKSYEKFLIN